VLQELNRGLDFLLAKRASCTALLRQLNIYQASRIAYVCSDKQESQRYCVSGAIVRLLRDQACESRKTDVNLSLVLARPTRRKTVLCGA
jgi:hypothetical protein